MLRAKVIIKLTRIIDKSRPGVGFYLRHSRHLLFANQKMYIRYARLVAWPIKVLDELCPGAPLLLMGYQLEEARQSHCAPVYVIPLLVIASAPMDSDHPTEVVSSIAFLAQTPQVSGPV